MLIYPAKRPPRPEPVEDYRQRDPIRWLSFIAWALATFLALALIDHYS